MYTYESSEQGDLTFQQGDVIAVLKKEGDWWTGAVADRTGVFPSNYVKPRDSEVSAARVWGQAWVKYVIVLASNAFLCSIRLA